MKSEKSDCLTICLENIIDCSNSLAICQQKNDDSCRCKTLIPSLKSGQKIRMVEIGSGSGGTSTVVMAAIAGEPVSGPPPPPPPTPHSPACACAHACTHVCLRSFVCTAQL